MIWVKILLIIIAIPVVIVLGLFLLIGIMGHGYEKTDLSDLIPFKDLPGSTVTLVRPALLAKNEKHFVKQNPYLMATDEGDVYETAIPRYWLPEGTPVTISNVKLFRQRMNGYRSIEVLGTAQIPGTNKTVKFEYSWGVENAMPMFEGKAREWTLPLAPWQDAPIDGIFHFGAD